jgi:hypothetical protein
MITTILVEDFELELAQNVSVPLNFSLQEFRDPEKRKRSFSKTITIPGTSKNKKFFMSAFEIGLKVTESASLTFKPNLAPKCIVKRGDEIIFRGLLKLNQVNILNNAYSFECTIYSEVVNIFSNLKSINLSELDWSEYDHTLTREVVINSWEFGVVKNGVTVSNFNGTYPSNGYDPKAFGYLYPLVNYGYSQPNSTTYKVNQLVPYVYVKECIQKILEYAYKDTDIVVDYTTNFFTNENMKKLIYGYGGGDQIKLSPTAVQASKIEFLNATYSNLFDLPPGTGNLWYLNFSQDFLYLLDEYGNIPSIQQNQNTIEFDNGGYVKINVKGIYTFNIKIVVSYYGGNVSNPVNNLTTLKVYKNNLYSVFSDTKTTVTNATYTLNYTFDLDCNPGDTYSFAYTAFVTSSTPQITMSITECDFTMSAEKSQELTDGSIVSLNGALPTIKCADFLKGILNMFYATISDPIYDPVTSKRIIYIDAFEDFYKDSKQYDTWTKKIDKLREINIESNSLIEGKNYIFKFNDEKDFFNNEYKRITGNNYGELDILFDTFQNEERVFKMPFSTYPSVKISGSNLRIPHIIENNGTTIKSYKGGGHLAFYNGLRPGNCAIQRAGNTVQTTSTNYPMIHHFRLQNSQDYIPLFDLHFQSRQYSFDEILTFPSLNTYLKYFARFINEMTSADAKLVRAYFNLNDNDIANMDFSKLKMIDGNLFRLYSIKDYDSQNLGSTQCELIKFLG